MAGITERNRQKNELANIGYSLKYIDEWQPKTTLYRHKPSYYVSGEIAADVGTSVKGVPGNPDYVLKKSRIGQFPWQPGETCTCKWCVERNRDGGVAIRQDEGVAWDLKQEESSATPQPQARGRRRMGPYFQQSQA
mgnify:CR=1 FL=1